MEAEGKKYFAGADGILVYYKTNRLKAASVYCQFSTNTSTLIPVLRILGLPYHRYFDQPKVVGSQNNITFYWKPSKLAAFYNRFSTDDAPLGRREAVIRRAVKFLTETAKGGKNFLPNEMLKGFDEPCRLLGFYQGFPIFDETRGMSKLLSRLGIHVGVEEVMISTPMDQYAKDIEEATRALEKAIGQKATWKNRTKFALSPKNS